MPHFLFCTRPREALILLVSLNENPTILLLFFNNSQNMFLFHHLPLMQVASKQFSLFLRVFLLEKTFPFHSYWLSQKQIGSFPFRKR